MPAVTGVFFEESITVGATVVSLNPFPVTPGPKAKAAEIQVQDQPIRERRDGGTPSATVGVRRTAGEIFHLTSANDIRHYRAIREGAADATLRVRYATDYIP